MDVLIGCEESGAVRDEFRAAGHNAWSCDLVPSRSSNEYHIQGDVKEAIKSRHWDLIILHPDCTKLACSGNRWYGKGTEGHSKRLEAIEWTIDLWELAKSKARFVALENPKGVLSKPMGKPQYIHPWQYGHGETKETGLWLHNLPDLQPTNIVDGRENKVWKMAPGPNRKRDRSKTYSGIAKAFADQWGFLGTYDNQQINGVGQ